MVQPRLVNDVFGDAGLLLDFSFGRRAILFDIGDLGGLSAREILRVRHVFVSHPHVDHFIGFDQLLRLLLHRDVEVTFFGPPGLLRAIESKLSAYTWNLLDNDSPDFVIHACEWDLASRLTWRSFRARRRFCGEEMRDTILQFNRIHEELGFHVEVEVLDHGTPSLAFAFQEKLRVNVHKANLEKLGLSVGPWLTKAKQLARSAAARDILVTTNTGTPITLAELISSGAMASGPGERVVYATDLAFSDQNVARLVGLARRADYFFIEAGLKEDAALAASKKHLTARQAGEIAAASSVTRAIPMHFSPRYLGREEQLRLEFQQAAWRADDRKDGSWRTGL
ncbi:MAG TPA: MBL fold metallo-hydrolase [Pseudorhizobium sp.]|jgi:ribonuclease Z|nr:MBL fold metallo-hydrolase [Pseudorhizobium sp.]